MTQQMICTQCGVALTPTAIQVQNWKKSGRVYCGSECVRAMRKAKGVAERQRPQVECVECGIAFVLENRGRISTWKRSGRTFCSETCKAAVIGRESSERMAQTNRLHASARMKAKNPMHDEATRAKMAATLKEIHHAPRVRGGNGAPMPEPHRRMAEMLGWPVEVSIAPGDGQRPYHYKADIAHPSMMVVVEIDGGSHYSLARRESDRRRDARLAGIGWLTFRFSNRDAMERTAECVATVLSTTSKWQPRTRT